MTRRTASGLCALILQLLLSTAANAERIGRFLEFDAAKGSVTDPQAVVVGDIIRVSLDIKLAGDVPDSSVAQGDALRKFALVQDAASYGAFYAADKPGLATVVFQYVDKATGQTALVTYIFKVGTKEAGRLIDLGRDNSLTDVATKKPPVDGVRVGDVIRFTVGKKNEVESVNFGVLVGDALRKAPVAVEGDFVMAYFSVERPGTAIVRISFKIVGAPVDGGFLSRPIDVHP